MVALPGALPLVGVMVAPLEAAEAAAAMTLPPPESAPAAEDSMEEPPAEARLVPEALLDLREADLGGILTVEKKPFTQILHSAQILHFMS